MMLHIAPFRWLYLLRVIQKLDPLEAARARIIRSVGFPRDLATAPQSTMRVCVWRENVSRLRRGQSRTFGELSAMAQRCRVAQVTRLAQTVDFDGLPFPEGTAFGRARVRKRTLTGRSTRGWRS